MSRGCSPGSVVNLIILPSIVVAALAPSSQAANEWFMPLAGTAWQISADGSTVVGHVDTGNGLHAARWELPSGNLQDLTGPKHETYPGEIAWDVSADGSVIAGTSWTWAHGESLMGAFRWSEADDRLALSQPFQRLYGVGASVVSGDGTCVVGGRGTTKGITIWRGESPPTVLSGTIGAISSARATSHDGDVIVGALDSVAALWNEDGGLVDLGVPAAYPESYASDITADGSLVVGNFKLLAADYRYEPFVWTAERGFVELEPYGNSQSTSVYGVSGDGLFMVGSAVSAIEPTVEGDGVIRGPNGRWRRLEDVVSSAGLGNIIAGWDLSTPMSISSDGRTIVGNGVNPDGVEMAWAVHVPEPGSGRMLLMGIVFAFHACRRTSTSLGKLWSATQ